MVFDIIALVVVLLAGVTGYRSGLMRQVARIVSLVVAFLVARTLSGPLGAQLQSSFQGSELAGRAVAFALVLSLTYLVLVLMVGYVVRQIRSASKTITMFDRCLGCVLGLLKGCALVFLAACVLVMLDEPLATKAPWLRLTDGQSRVGRLALSHNLVAAEVLPRALALRTLVRLAQGQPMPLNPELERKARNLLKQKDAAMLHEADKQAAILEGRWADVVWDDRIFGVIRLLEDRRLSVELAAAAIAAALILPSAPVLPNPAPLPAERVP